jgi:osmotically-inducible protein OsmY
VLAAAVACSASDPGITTAVKSKLAADDTVKAYQIDVDTREGVVTLRGNVDNPAAKARAAELARDTDGVTNVVDNIVVAGGSLAMPEGTRDAAADAGEATSDAGITSAVKTKMLADTRVKGLDIDVDTEDGVVTLTGKVETAAQKSAALAIAKGTDNVKSVNDKLTVGR